jgi:hypothetical protein
MSPDDDLACERPLILDPCQDGPNQLLSFNSLGEIIAMGDDPRGQATIDVFHLNREPLSDRRQSVVVEIVEALVILNSEQEEIPLAARKEFLSWLQRRWLNDSCEYAGVARAIQRNPAAFGLSPEDVVGLG